MTLPFRALKIHLTDWKVTKYPHRAKLYTGQSNQSSTTKFPQPKKPMKNSQNLYNITGLLSQCLVTSTNGKPKAGYSPTWHLSPWSHFSLLFSPSCARVPGQLAPVQILPVVITEESWFETDLRFSINVDVSVEPATRELTAVTGGFGIVEILHRVWSFEHQDLVALRSEMRLTPCCHDLLALKPNRTKGDALLISITTSYIFFAWLPKVLGTESG